VSHTPGKTLDDDAYLRILDAFLDSILQVLLLSLLALLVQKYKN
jgi:hypothetical protein